MSTPSPKNLRVPYETAGFKKSSPIRNGPGSLPTCWDDILWAAVTVGRPSRAYVFKHKDASAYEALFRWSAVRMALEGRGHGASRLRRTAAVRSLDPTEKGAISYFLGMTFAKLFASELLKVPWLLHLDVFKDQVAAVLTERSRPDLVGEDAAGQWIAVECKGRSARPDTETTDKAKRQAKRIKSIGGKKPRYHIATFTYFADHLLHFAWEDPEPDENEPEPIRLTVPGDAWKQYYGPVLGLLRSREGAVDRVLDGEREPIEEADVRVGVHPEVMRLLLEEDWGGARELANEKAGEWDFRADGIVVEAGQAWSGVRTGWWVDGG
ncbi:MAG: hypothetical protein VYE22_28455 [Myxococcota bacterium]|nr:hypothetical protein [Myxococcota bacterium]